MEQYKELEQIKALIAQQEVAVLLIKSENCSVCVAVEHQLEEWLAKRSGVMGLKTFLHEVPSLSGEYMVFSAPTVLLFIEGREVWRGSRFISFEDLEKNMDRWTE